MDLTQVIGAAGSDGLLQEFDIVAVQLFRDPEGLRQIPRAVAVDADTAGIDGAEDSGAAPVVLRGELELEDRPVREREAPVDQLVVGASADGQGGRWYGQAVEPQQLVQWAADGLAEQVVQGHVDG
ncbi:hypothetical protein SMICM17S_13233 [Streptomyces microflavus]